MIENGHILKDVIETENPKFENIRESPLVARSTQGRRPRPRGGSGATSGRPRDDLGWGARKSANFGKIVDMYRGIRSFLGVHRDPPGYDFVMVVTFVIS